LGGLVPSDWPQQRLGSRLRLGPLLCQGLIRRPPH
jgi:hypothetical protein